MNTWTPRELIKNQISGAAAQVKYAEEDVRKLEATLRATYAQIDEVLDRVQKLSEEKRTWVEALRVLEEGGLP